MKRKTPSTTSPLKKATYSPIPSSMYKIIQKGLENRENALLSALANECLNNPEEAISHDDVWRELLPK